MRKSITTRGGADLPRFLKARLIVAVVAVAIVVGGCSGSDSNSGNRTGSGSQTTAPKDRSGALASMADDVIVPGLEELTTRTAALIPALESMCSAVGPETLESARKAWESASGAWAETAAYRFGPAAKLRSAAGISYPINTTKIDKMFSPGGDFATAPATAESVTKLGADKRGLAAIEYLLFSLPDTVGTPAATNANQCSFLVAAATDVDVAAKALASSWTTGSTKLDHPGPFTEQFRSPGSSSMYKNQQEAIDAAVNTMSSALQGVGDMVLGPATGKTTPEPDPAIADPGAAHRKLDDAKAALASVSKLYGSGNERLSGIVAAQSSKADNDADKSFRNALSKAQAALDQVPGPIGLMDQKTASSGPLVEAWEHVDRTRVILRTEVASQLGVTIGFSDSDGDG